MIRRIAPVLAVVTVSAAFAARAGTPLSDWAQKINALKSLQGEVAVATPGQPTQKYTVAMAKPSSFRVDGDAETISADGTTITVYDKAKNYFYTRPQTETELKGLFSPDQYALFRAFFDGKAFDGKTSRVGETKTLGGESVTPIQVADRPGAPKTFTFYVSKDGLARKAELLTILPSGKKSSVMTARNLVLDADLPADTFAFSAPAGAEEVKYADLIANKWFTDLDEAKSIASKTGRKILIAFSSPRSEQDKLMEKEVFATDRFKALGKKFVFLRINVDEQPTVAAAYKIEAVPTQVVASADGTEAGREVGYDDAEAFFDFVDQY